MMIEDLTDARILVELRRRLGFAEAARALQMPPATLSRRVIAMEERAGLLLFERTTRTVAITEAGDLAADHAERMLLEAEAMQGSMDGLRGMPSGTVRVTAPIIFGQTLLGGLAGRFVERHPACDLAIELSDGPMDLIAEKFDVAIRVGPIGDESLRVKSLGSVEASLFRRSQVRDAPAPRNIEELTDHPIAVLHRGYGQDAQLTLTSRTIGTQHTIDIQPKLVCLNPWLLLDAALDTDMLVVLPDVVGMPVVADGRLEQVLPDWVARRADVNIAFPSRRLMRPAVRAFVDLAVEHLRSRLAPDA